MKSKEESNLMDLIPECICESEKQQDGTIHVLYPRFNIAFLRKRLLPYLKRPFFHIKLDKIGTCVWESIDGNRNVYNVGILVAQKLGKEENENWHLSMATYIHTLKRSGLIQLKHPIKPS